ncbi:hypothetical protein DNHGIG_32500 [Collibacillus ludicampi]|uniref:Uncharacterized protein n=1 Tax=Collibacillus ludicampi TaxID=2771369 RepID=A0AAV4LIW8_9BACL|nr:hypothetical protein DNHGIG_32500 [Collibacillus ludicampi]
MQSFNAKSLTYCGRGYTIPIQTLPAGITGERQESHLYHLPLIQVCLGSLTPGGGLK